MLASAVQQELADLVDDEDGRAQERGELAVEPAGGFGGAEPADEVVDGGEVHGEPGPRRPRRRSWSLPTPGGPSTATLDLARTNSRVPRSRTFAGIQVGLEGGVEVVEALVVGRPEQLQPVAEPACLTQAEFFFQP